jgi:DNA processing protein
LEAARACGQEVARHGLTVVSGYAKGVDMETHLGALEANGKTIIVLAEGMLHWRKKKALQVVGAQDNRLLVVSQFPPAQTWNAGAAMTRNGVIAGLGRALVVVEAGDRGGTLDAGMQALRMKRPVLALEFSTQAPAGNAILFTKGARRIASLGDLKRALDAVGEPLHQLSFAGLG